MSQPRSSFLSGTATSRSRTAACVPHRRRHPGPGQPAAADAGKPRQGPGAGCADRAQDVIRIDRDAKEVEVHDLAQGRTYRESYDKLVLCLGAEPVRPGPRP
jgi:NADPH-dependent 2,4-dienoyl-CoA reductase/sulfur reductase-like enzyme